MATNRTQLSLLCGVIGPVLFAVVSVVAAATRPGYDYGSQFISELGETGATHAWVMNGFGFILSGVLILIFVIAARRQIPGGALNVIGSLFLIAFAVCLSLAGVYSCDVGCSPANPTSDQQLHDLVSIIAFPVFILGAMTWGVLFLRQAGWRRFGGYSLISGIAALVVLVAMVDSEPTRDGTGILQRLFLAILFAWLIALLIRLQREPPRTEST